MLYRKFESVYYDYIKLDTVEKLLEYLKDARKASPKASKENLTPSRGGVEFAEKIYGLYTYPAKITVSRGKVVISVMWIMDAYDDSDFVAFNGDIYSTKEVKPIAKCLADWMNDLDDGSDDLW